MKEIHLTDITDPNNNNKKKKQEKIVPLFNR